MESLSGKKVLLVEDHPAIRHLVSVVLERFDLHLIFANNGLAALEAIDAHEPDLVLLDLRLPDIDGWEVLGWVRARRSKTELPIVIVTAYGGDGDENRALQLGANGYIPKPFDPETLRRAVCEFLGGCLSR